ncbi:MAG: hypothetical protein OXC60_16935 [Litoreibacter sp.]|nr:hypothetical protein [Litoreibacter sp.]
MIQDRFSKGGAAIGVLNRMEAWEANLILNLRLWLDGTEGQTRVWSEYRKALSGLEAQNECRAFETLITTIASTAPRPLVRHEVHCVCAGADECTFLHLVRCASDGDLYDAALMAALLAGPSRAEQIALLAGQVGTCARKLTRDRITRISPKPAPYAARLH